MKLGRNDPCHCGSGRKYKHCHYNEDKTAEAAALKAAAEEAAADPATEQEPTDSPNSQTAAEKAAATGRRDFSGSRFMRTPSSGAAKSGGKGPGSSPRTTRGAQRGS